MTPALFSRNGRTSWARPSGAIVLTAIYVLEHVQRIVGEPGLRTGAEHAGVVDEQVQSARSGDRVSQIPPVTRVGDVARDGGQRAGLQEQRVDGLGQPRAVASVDDDVPAAADELGRQRTTEAARSTCDERDPGAITGGHTASVQVQVNMKSSTPAEIVGSVRSGRDRAGGTRPPRSL